MTMIWRNILMGTLMTVAAAVVTADPPGRDWKLVFSDDFTDGEAGLDARWEAQNGPSGHILCSRWRDNARVENGLLKLIVRKEKRGGQDWTAASLWTRERFKYGYFECRYRYAPSTGTNNSFWLMTRDYIDRKRKIADVPGQFEIDINEGKYPNVIAMNLHNWSGRHWANSELWYSGAGAAGQKAPEPTFSLTLEKPIRTTALRLVSDDYEAFRVMEVRAFRPRPQGYPAVMTPGTAGNLAASARVEADSVLDRRFPAAKAVDGRLDNDSRWVSDYSDGPHVLTFSWPEAQTIGALQLVTGWYENGKWRGAAANFRFEYRDGSRWLPVPGAYRCSPGAAVSLKDEDHLGRTFHTYALEWNEKELVYYFDGRVIRRLANPICHRPSPVWLSLAVVRWGGPVTDELDGKSMDVDYVKVWQKK